MKEIKENTRGMAEWKGFHHMLDLKKGSFEPKIWVTP
jgi:hypothetical protein